MIKTLKNILFSTRLMAILFVVFAVAMGIATFIETYYNTDTARIWIYNTWWFEAIMLIFMLNFIGNIKKYSLLKKEKWAVLLLHLSWIFIILGAFVTRYISNEGRMSIREGETADFYTSEQTFITIFVDGFANGQNLRKVKQKKVLFAEKTNNDFVWNSDFMGQKFKVEYKNFIPHANYGFIKDENSTQEFLKIVESSTGTRQEHFIKNGEIANIQNNIITLNNPQKGAINIKIDQNGAFIESPTNGMLLDMIAQKETMIKADSLQSLKFLNLYHFTGFQFVIPENMQKGKLGVTQISKEMQTPNDENAVVFEVSVGDKKQEVAVLGRKDVINPPQILNVEGLSFAISYGSIREQLPFSIKLNDFIADKYPGTENSYSAFKSKVDVLDPSADTKQRPYEIFMNNILNYRGYRFFQASFHPDEKGTILSVNYDFWGTTITYIGYALLYIGLIASMFFGKTRFVTLSKKLKKLQEKRFLILFLGLFSVSTFAQHHNLFTEKQIDSIITSTKVDKAHANKFGKLVVQDDDGRMKPINTFSSELLRKISKKDTFKDLNADQVFLSMMINPELWYNVPFFYVKKDNDSLHRLLKVEEGKKYVRAIDFFDEKFSYKLSPFLEEAYRTNTPTQFQKDFKDADTKLSLLNRALTGGVLRIFPLLNSENNKWVSTLEYRQNPNFAQDTLYHSFINNSVSLYLSFLKEATQTNNYEKADRVLDGFIKNQQEYGKNVIPSPEKINAEILYNRYDIFKSLFSWYMYAGVLLFVFLIIEIFTQNASKENRKKIIQYSIIALKVAIIFCFILHTLGLGFRWYISGHAPWSNAYESMIYVAWATMAAGLFFYKRSPLTFASTAFVTSMILMVAHWNWMDPSIGTLQPVLNSYWLMLHVAIIVGSYGPFALGLIIGFVVMLMMIFKTKKNAEKIDAVINELTIVNELSLTVGLAMLTIGNFVGGQWANESWGRYWGWDPKETWALISIMVYAFVIHMRLVPKLRGKWAFNFASVVAFASILMTYFGVNFYLSGLHSYASGDKVITPNFVYYSVAIVALIGSLSYFKNKKFKEEQED